MFCVSVSFTCTAGLQGLLEVAQGYGDSTDFLTQLQIGLSWTTPHTLCVKRLCTAPSK